MLKELARKIDPLLPVRLGRYERENIRTLRSLVDPGMTVWDVGANIGQVTYHLCKLVGPFGFVVSIEPSQKTIAQLRKSFGKRAHIIEAAVSDEDGFEAFRGDGRADGRLDPAGNLLVKTITLDSLLSVMKNAPSVVKLDIEGHELAALRGASRLLREASPVLAVEFHGAGLPDRDLDAEARALVASFGYRWSLTPGGWMVASPARRAGPGWETSRKPP